MKRQFLLSGILVMAAFIWLAISSSVILAQARLPDLTIESISVDKNGNIQVKIRNNGPGIVPDKVWTDHSPKSSNVMLYKNGKKWDGEKIWKFDPKRALQKPGGTTIYESKLQIKSSALIMAMVDETKQLKEINEKNNSISKKIKWPEDVPTGSFELGDRIVLSEGSIGTATPQITQSQSGNNIYVTWSQGTTNEEVFCIRSNNSGDSFGSRRNLSNTSARSYAPQIAAYGNYVYVVWCDEFTSGGDIFFSRSTNSGSTFNRHVNLSNSSGNRSVDPQITASGNYVYVVWVETVDMGTDIMLRVSTNNGATFGDIINLSEDVEHGEIDGIPTYWPVDSPKPSLVAVDRNVYIAWQNGVGEFERRGSEVERVRQYNATVFRASTNNGATFDAPIILGRSASRWGRPRTAAMGNNVYVVWPDMLGISGGNEDILFRGSTDRGATFADAINLSNTTARSTDPDISASGNSVYVLWRDDVGGDEDILFRATTNRGRSFNSVINLSHNNKNSVSPSTVAASNNVFVAWQQERSTEGYDIFFSSSTNNGSSFSEAINISDVSPHGSSHAPTVIAYGNNVYTIWQDHAYGAIFRKCSSE
jgi:hypothetical protein